MKKIALFLVLASTRLFAQGGVYAGPTVVNGVGQPIANASVYVVIGNPCGTSPTYTFCNGQAQGIYTGPVPPSPLAVLYTDITLGTTKTNPIVTDPLGNWTVYTNPGVYWAVITGYQIVPSVQPIVVGNGQGGGGSVNCATALNGSLAAFLSPTSLGCDQNMGTDFAGNGFAQSWKYLGPVNGFFGVIGGAPDPGTQAKFKLNANEVRALAPLTVPTPYYWRWPSTPCAVGQVWNVTGSTTDANGDTVTTYGCLTPSSGVSITATSPIVVTPSPITGTGVISCPTCNTGTLVAALDPSAPVVTNGGTPGAVTDTYGIVMCEDQSCTKHSAISPTGTTTTANATLSSTNFNLLKTYADTLYGYRYAIVCRLSAGGTPSTTGIIATGVGKQFKDTGQAGDGTNCTSTYATNNTGLDQHCVGAALPLGVNVIPGAPCGVDAPPTSPVLRNDEFSWGPPGSWVPGDTNDPQWQQINWGTSTATLTSGQLIIAPQNTAGNAIRMLGTTGSMPSPTWEFELKFQPHLFGPSSGSIQTGMCLYDGTKVIEYALDSRWNTGISVNYLTDVNTYSSTPLTMPGSATNTAITTYPNWLYFKIKDDSTNYTFSWSLDGVDFVTLGTAAVGAFLGAPTSIGPCQLATPTGSSMSIDFFRETI